MINYFKKTLGSRSEVIVNFGDFEQYTYKVQRTNKRC